MSELHILRLNQKGEPSHAYHAGNEKLSARVGSISSWTEVEKNLSWTLLLPSPWVYQTETHVPSKSNEVLKQSIPFAVEEEISNEVEDNHFAFTALSENKQKVSVIAHAQMALIKSKVKQHDIKVDRIHSEVDFCPKAAHTATVWQSGDQILLCIGETEHISIERGQLSDMLPVFAADLEFIQSNQSLEGVDIKHLKHQVDFDLPQCFAALSGAHVVNIKPHNWLQENNSSQPKQNKLLLVLTLLLILSWSGIKFYQHHGIDQQIESLQLEQLNMFQERFGDASGSELADPFAALQSRMQRVNQNQATTSPLIDALHYLGRAMQNHRQHIEIMALRLVEQKLEIQLTAESMTQINAFQKSLQQAALTFKVLIGVNEQDAGRFKSVITMERL